MAQSQARAMITVSAPTEKPAAPIAWIDACKGIGIYLVVLGHSNINAVLHQFIYLFHMPLFFFLSGYLHTTKYDFRQFAKKKAIHLLLPYASFLLLLYPLELLRVYHHHKPGHEVAHSLYAATWGGSSLHGLYGVFWFLPCLFLTQQLMNLLLAKCRVWIVGAVVFAGLVLSYANAALWPHFTLPLDANVVFAAMPFFYFGFLSTLFNPRSSIVLIAAALGATTALYLDYLLLPISYDMRDGIYGTPGVTFVLAMCCIVCVMALSKVCTKIGPVRQVFTSLGAASMGIMFIHKALPAIPMLGRFEGAHGYLASVVFSFMSLLTTLLLQRLSLSRALLLGSEKDFSKLIGGSVSIPTRDRVDRVLTARRT